MDNQVINKRVSVSGCKPHPRNYNTHDDGQVEDLRESLRQFGQVRSIVVQATKKPSEFLIVAGHGVTEAARREGIKTLKADVIPAAWRPARVLAYLAADNELARRGNPDEAQLAAIVAEVQQKEGDVIARLAAGEQRALDNLLRLANAENGMADAEPQIDRAEELNRKWKVRTGDLWRIGEHRLLCGDSTKREDVDRVMMGERADCAFTSPPYAVGVDYGKDYQDTIDNLRKMLPLLSRSLLSVVTDGGFAVINFGDVASGRNIAKVTDPCEYPMALEYWPIFRADGWLLWSRRIWCKPNPRVHSPWCIQSNRAATDWEHLWTWRKVGNPIIKRVDGELRSALGWIDTSLMHGVDVGKDDHGAGMALGIAAWMINVHSRNNAPVYEPLCGTGTTIVACQNLQRKCRAIEISPAYCAVILERMATAFPGIEIERLEAGSNGTGKRKARQK